MRGMMIAALLLAGTAAAFGQKKALTNFTLSGKIKGKPSGFLFLSYKDASGNYRQDSTAIKNGSFVFKGNLPEPEMATLLASSKIRNMDDPNLGSVFLEPVPMKINLEYGDFKNLKLTGSKSQQEQDELTALKAPIRKEMEPVLEAYRKEKDHEKAAEIRDQFEPFNVRMDKIDYAFMAAHPDSYVTAYAMRFKLSSLTAAEARGIYNGWTERIRTSLLGKEIDAEIVQLEKGSPGNQAALFNSVDIKGNRLTLADFKGKKYVLLDFWASWCVPCRKGNPNLISLYNKYKDQGLEIIGVASDDTTPDAWRKAVEQDKIGIWKHVLSGLKRTATGYDRSEAIGERYGIHTLPTKILIDKAGKIIGRYGGGGEDDAAMDRKLAELFVVKEAALKPFILKGTIKGQASGTLRLAYAASEGKYIQDSTEIRDGAFEFKGQLVEPVMTYFSGAVKSRDMDDPNLTSFFLEPGNLTMEVTAGDFKNLKLKGSKTQDEVTALNIRKKPYTDQLSVLSVAYDKANAVYIEARKAGKPEGELDVLKEAANAAKDKMDPFREEMGKLDLEYIKNHPDSYYSGYALRWKVSSLPLAESKILYAKLSDRVKQSSYGNEIAKEIKSLEGGSPGSPASMFSSTDINGQPLDLADFKGKKYVLLDFWASWCVPCRKGNPHLLSLYSKYKDKGLEIIGISDDDSAPDAWRKAVEKDGIGVWKHVLRGLKRTTTGFDKSEDISAPFGIHSLPTKILIDKEGMIIGRYGGGGEDDKAMDKKLAEIFN